MSAYPMIVRSVSMDHRGGTKSYHLMLAAAANGNAIFVSRWGKKGAIGEMKVETFTSLAAAEKAWDKKERAKASNGYSQAGRLREEVAQNVAELRSKMGLPVWTKVGKNVSHLDPTIDVSGMRETDDPGYDEDGRKLDNSRKADLSAQIEAQKAAERAESEKILAAHPNFGRFG